MVTQIENTSITDLAPLRIKDLMLGELLCQAGILTDTKLLELAALARSLQGTLGSALVFSTVLSQSELFVARRTVNRYINDSDNAQQYINELSNLLNKRRTQRKHDSIHLAKLTRKYMDQELFLVS